MGGVDKAALRVGGVTLLDRVLGSARPVCQRLVVVGPARPTGVPGVAFVTEGQPGGGPVPAVLAGVEVAPECDVVLVLATDLPLLTVGHLRRLLDALGGSDEDAAAAADAKGPNPLLAAYRVPALAARAVALGLGRDTPAGRLLPTAVTVDLGAATLNVNRPEDLAAAELLVVHPVAVSATVHWLRELVRATVPGARESVHSSQELRYSHPTAGLFCAVWPGATGVKLVLYGPTQIVDVAAPGYPPAAQLAEMIDARFQRPTTPNDQITRSAPA